MDRGGKLLDAFLSLLSGAGGTFGNSQNDSYVYVGGLPSSYWRRMSSLSAPSAMFLPRFNGYVRNVLYGNCSCMRLRAGLPLDGDGYTILSHTDDSCDSPGVRHNCTRQCLCIGTDHGRRCDCSDAGCNGGTVYVGPVLRLLLSIVAIASALQLEAVRDTPALCRFNYDAMRIL